MDQRVQINRALVGWLALGCLIGAAACFLFVDDSTNNAATDLWRSILMRVGIVLTALWMALPSDGRIGNWKSVSLSTLIGIVAAIFMVAREPRRFLPLFLVVAVMARYLRPRDKPRPPREFE